MSAAPAPGAPPEGLTQPLRHLTWALPEWLEVDGDVVLFAAQRAVAALQVVPVAGILSNPLDLVAAVGFSRELGNGALAETG